jgi:endoglucanase
LKAFYYQRSGEPIEAEYAGQWARPAGHLDTTVLVHPSAESKGRPAETVLSSPGGWYDAGDYNKYIVNSSFTIGEILTIYQCCPGYFKTLNTNIPESSNELPDVLDEMLVNLKWMLTMQDPTDGGVYHKLTNPDFEGFVMPTDCHQQRYVVQKSTAATLDFIATMALASRIYRKYDAHKEFAQQALNAAMKAWSWARLHPKVVYSQMELNKKFNPKVNTGEYGDWRFDDEFFWAASALYRLTGRQCYLDDARKHQPTQFTTPSWGGVASLGAMEWLTDSQSALYAPMKQQLLAYCEAAVKGVDTSSFQAPFGNKATDFGWGCLSEKLCCQALLLLYADRLTGTPQYRRYALQNADYLLGRNATGYCYVTGFGDKSPMHPHHRPSEADAVEAPFPGMLVGGPNPGQQDKATINQPYPSDYADESYLDDMSSYASNEIAINWNASLVAYLCWLDALQ